jgi:hypothetical protein
MLQHKKIVERSIDSFLIMIKLEANYAILVLRKRGIYAVCVRNLPRPITPQTTAMVRVKESVEYEYGNAPRAM